MKIYGITIEPQSVFGTPLKGDTIFGQFCWQMAENPELPSGWLDQQIGCYGESPFAVFSSAWPVLQRDGRTVYALPRPAGLSSENSGSELSRRERIVRNKADKKRKWLLVDTGMQVQLSADNLQTDGQLFELFRKSRGQEENRMLRLLPGDCKKLCTPVVQAHNSINRLTMSTGSGQFAPFTHDNFSYLPGLSLIIFAAVDEQRLDAPQLQAAFEGIGRWGFGRDASAGLGRFRVVSVEEHPWPQAAESASACYTLGPAVPQKQSFDRCYAEPFTRFGRHGAALACSGKPFKKPVIMADEGALLFPKERAVFDLPWIGTAVSNVSLADKRTVVQGYSLYLPC